MLDRILIGSSAEPSDPNFENVTLLLHGDGSNGAQNNTFIDSSTNNFTITRNGNTTQGSFSPYGSNWSNYFDGSGDYLSTPSNAAFGLSGADFTIEAWVYVTSSSEPYQHIVKVSGGANNLIYIDYSGGSNGVLASQVGGTIATQSGVTLNTWHHVAVVRSGTSVKCYVNGVGGTAQTIDPGSSGSVSLLVGYDGGSSPARYFNGYISNLRVVKGTAVYTANFTPPTQPLTAITNTSLLTCADNRFRDGSTNNFTITRNGDVKVTNFAPFAPSSAYSTTTNGGSAYFDGSGDYLSSSATAATQMGSSSFTTEAWFYLNSLANPQYIYMQQDASVGSNANLSYSIVVLTDGSIVAVLASGNSRYDISSAANAVRVGTWCHVALVRNGNVFTLYLNGVSVATTTQAITLNSNALNYVGAYINVGAGVYDYLNGYVSNLRIVKGTAVYTAAFTPPSSPVTAITNTSLLLNATNAAIFDNSMKNDLETVGNAQISTSVKKFGTGSMYFDGSGDYLVSNASSDLYAFGTGDFTIEMWFNLSSFSSLQILYDSRPTSTDGLYPLIYVASGGGSVVWQISATAQITGTTTLSTGVWYHLAVSRSSGSTKMFLNGTQIGSTYSDTNAYLNSGTNRPFIGGSSYSAGTLTVNGYIDDVRVTKGIARYTASFTAPTAPFPNK